MTIVRRQLKENVEDKKEKAYISIRTFRLQEEEREEDKTETHIHRE